MSIKNQITVDYSMKKVSIDDFNETKFIADYFQPSVKGNYAIIVLGGSEGGKPTHLANKIASLGYAVLSLAYFNYGDFLPNELEMIPLEYFDTAKQWLLKKEDIRQDGVLIVGWSKGAELGLVLTSRDNDYKGIIAIAPSSVVWPGIIRDWSRKVSSSWSFDKKPLSCIPYSSQMLSSKKISDLYRQSLENMVAPINETINYKNIKVPTLLLSGSQDIIWPSDQMAQAICKEINSHHSDELMCYHYNYKNAGHLLDEQFDLGGNKESNGKANRDSFKKIEQFIKKVNISI